MCEKGTPSCGGCGGRDVGLMAEAVRQALIPSKVLAARTGIVSASGPLVFDWHAPFAAVAVNVLSSATAASGGIVTTGANTYAAAAGGNTGIAQGASMTGFDITTGPVAAAVSGVVTVLNLQGGTLSYELVEQVTGTTLSVRFPNPIPASSAGVFPQVAMPAIGSGGVSAVNVYGLTAATAAGSTAPLTLVAGTASGATAPTQGPGVAVIPANKGSVVNLRGNSLTIWGGNPGDQVTVQAFTQPQPAAWG